MRVHEIVSFSARKKFRLTYPPRYECYRCYATFVLRKECYDHVKYRCRVIHSLQILNEDGTDGKYVLGTDRLIEESALLTIICPSDKRSREYREVGELRD